MDDPCEKLVAPIKPGPIAIDGHRPVGDEIPDVPDFAVEACEEAWLVGHALGYTEGFRDAVERYSDDDFAAHCTPDRIVIAVVTGMVLGGLITVPLTYFLSRTERRRWTLPWS